MSIKTLWQSILLAFGHIPKDIDKYATDALEVTTRIREALQSPFADAITALIPGDVDEAVRKQLLKALEVTIPALQIVDKCNGLNREEMIQCWIAELSRMPISVQDALLHKLHSLLTAYQHGKELKQNMYDLYAQFVYSRGSKKNE